MTKKYKDMESQNLPACAVEFIKLVIRKMRYRKKVQADVQAELTAHFEDELRDCKTDEEKEKRAQQLIAEFGDVKLLAVLLRRAKKRCRPLWRTAVARAFQAVGVLILCLILYCIYISLGKPNIRVNYVEEALRIARAQVAESQNAAPLYQKAIDAYKEPPLVEDEKGIEKSLLDVIQRKSWVAELTEEELALTKNWLSDNNDAAAFFTQAAEMPYCWWHRQAENDIVIVILIPEMKGIKNIARLLSWRARLDAFNGNIEPAFDDLLTCYCTGRHLKGPLSLIEQLVGMALQGLSAGTAVTILQNRQINGELLRNFQADIEKLMAEDTFIADYTTERFLALDFLQRCYTDNGSGSGHMIPGAVGHFPYLELWNFESDLLNYSRSLGMALVSADRDDMSREFEKLYSNAQQWAHKTPWQLHNENVDLEMGLDSWPRLKKVRYWPIMLLMPAIGRVGELTYRNKAGIEALVTVVALLRYHQDNGRYPQNLDELVDGAYLRRLPMDPYSAQSMCYKKTDDTFILYSVGLNFKDDGGTVAVVDGRTKSAGTKEQGDWVFWPVVQ